MVRMAGGCRALCSRMLRCTIYNSVSKILEAQMKHQSQFGSDRQSLAEIEWQARQMRAETLAAGGAAMRRALVRFFTRREAARRTVAA